MLTCQKYTPKRPKARRFYTKITPQAIEWAQERSHFSCRGRQIMEAQQATEVIPGKRTAAHIEGDKVWVTR
jgi:hypothetical protein